MKRSNTKESRGISRVMVRRVQDDSDLPNSASCQSRQKLLGEMSSSRCNFYVTECTQVHYEEVFNGEGFMVELAIINRQGMNKAMLGKSKAAQGNSSKCSIALICE